MTAQAPPFLRARQIRYLAVVLLGFAVDFCVSLALLYMVALSTAAAAAAGFCVALALNYLLFELWAFAGDDARTGLSVRRFALTILAALLALVARVSVILALGRVLPALPMREVILLLMGAGASVTVNFLLVSRLFIRKSV